MEEARAELLRMIENKSRVISEDLLYLVYDVICEKIKEDKENEGNDGIRSTST